MVRCQALLILKCLSVRVHPVIDGGTKSTATLVEDELFELFKRELSFVSPDSAGCVTDVLLLCLTEANNLQDVLHVATFGRDDIELLSPEFYSSWTWERVGNWWH
ncbi:MAG: hypothetical protein HC767_07325 [Akkermansiaceae bacterium]|nr:hypothetical protein [Akkermansiaceae bacterium]